MKFPFLLMLAVFVMQSAFAQVSQKYFGKSGMSAFVNKSALLSGSTNRVVVGGNKSATGDDDAFISCIDAADNILWTKEIKTAQQDRFMSVVATADGGCVAVGYVNQIPGSPYHDNQAAVYKFNASGTVLWNKVFKATSYGEIFYSVVEIPGSGDIICAGLYDFGNGWNNAGIVVSLNSSGTTNWAQKYFMNKGNQIQDIVYHKGKIICMGFYRGTSFYDGQIFAIKPSDGSVIWNRGFECVSSFSASCNSQWGDRIQMVNDTLYADVYLTGTWGAASSTAKHSPLLIRFDTLGKNPFCLEYPIAGPLFTSVIHSKVVSSKEIYLFQHSAAKGWDRLHSASPLTDIADVSVTKIKDMANPLSSMVYSRKFSTDGAQAVVCAEISGGKIRGWGGSINDLAKLIGKQDIFKFESDTSLPVLPSNCVINEPNQVFGHPAINMDTGLAFTSVTAITFVTPIVPSVTTVAYSVATACISVAPNVLKADFLYLRTSCYGFDFTDLSTFTSSGIKYWKWSFGDGGTSGLQNPKHTYVSPGIYVVKLVVEDSLGMKDSIAKTLSFSARQFAEAGNDSIACASGDFVNFQLNASGGKTYSWSPAAGLSNVSIANPVASIASTSTYVVTVKDSLGCEDKDTVTLTIGKGDIDVVAGPDNIAGCVGTEVQLTANGAKQYQWSPGAGLDKDNIANPKVTLSGIGQYIVTGTDSNGCTDKDTVLLLGHALPYVDATSDFNTTDCERKLVTLTATGALYYSWTPAIYCVTPNKATTEVAPPATKVFTVKGVDEHGCSSEDTISVYYVGQSLVKVPNAFTPDNDQKNDLFHPIIVCDFILSEFSVYGRWGEQIFRTADMNASWDGTFKGRPCELGVYFYMIKGTNSQGEEVLMKGDVSLLR